MAQELNLRRRVTRMRLFKVGITGSGRAVLVANRGQHYSLIWVSNEQKGPLQLTERNMAIPAYADFILNETSLDSTFEFIGTAAAGKLPK